MLNAPRRGGTFSANIVTLKNEFATLNEVVSRVLETVPTSL